MPTEAAIVTPPVEAPAPVVVPQEPKAPEKPQAIEVKSIKEHAAEHGDKQATVRPRRDEDRATPADARAIDAQTKRFHEAGEKLGITRETNESNRSYNLRVQAEIAERLAAQQPKEREPEPAKIPAPPAVKFPQAGEFKEPEPTLEQFANDADPAASYFRALARHEYRKEQFETTQKAAADAAKTGGEQLQAWWGERRTEHEGRFTSFQGNPANAARVADVERQMNALAAQGINPVQLMTPIIDAALILHPKSVEMGMVFATDPDLATTLFSLTSDKRVGDPTRNPLVAEVQRRLLKAVTVSGSTGEALARSPKPIWTPPPSPPTPVRTQATATATSESDKEKDSGSILAHARRYSPRD